MKNSENKSKKEFKKILIWSIVNGTDHPELKDEDRIYTSLVEALFPGMNYYSISGIHQVFNNYVLPVLKKLFSGLESLDCAKVNPEDWVTIKPFLPSKGYEHLDDPKWMKKFNELIKK